MVGTRRNSVGWYDNIVPIYTKNVTKRIDEGFQSSGSELQGGDVDKVKYTFI